MKVLFVGEGKNDIGPSELDSGPRAARGVVPALARKVVALINEDCPALAWRELSLFDPRARKKGFAAKVTAAILVSSRRFACGGTVCVADRDRDGERLTQMAAGRETGLELAGGAHGAVCGVAVESVEAWTLGAPEALAEELGLDPGAVRKEYPKTDVESLHENSGKPEHRPKALLARIANLKNRSDDTEFREAVAQRTDIAALERACQKGFRPFAEELRVVFGAGSAAEEGAST
jgi:hypothetical protein